MKCMICNRDADNKLCKYHELAYDKVKKNYDTWKKAYDNLKYDEYLTRLLELDESGEFIRDVVKWQLSLFKDEKR
ncbi:MAG: hypothetical protein QW416_01975 [Candidatus Nitrosocaldaceae archaeon]